MSVTDTCFKDVAIYNKEFGCEIGWRMCSGRAYYSMYHKTVGQLSQYSYSGKGTHHDLIKYLEHDAARLEGKNKMECKKLAYILNQAKAERKIADYDINNDFNEKLASSALKTAQKYNALVESTFD